MRLVVISEEGQRVEDEKLRVRERLALRLLRGTLQRGRYIIPKKLHKKQVGLLRLLEEITRHLHKIYIDPPEHYGPTLDRLYNAARKFQGRKEIRE